MSDGTKRTRESLISTRVAIVTGAAKGIGRAISETLAESGQKVIVADIDEDEGRYVAKRIGGHFIRSDLRKRRDCQKIVTETLERFGKVSILVNNAGLQHISPIEAFQEDAWEEMIALMLTAPFLLTKYVWSSMKSQHWGRIVNIASVHGLVASESKSAYVAAKHGLIGLTRAAGLEGGPHGITVNAVCPAYVRTKLVEDQIVDQAKVRVMQTQDVIEKIMLEQACIKRLIEPNEVASLVQYICSDAASAITGAALPVDVGWTAR